MKSILAILSAVSISSTLLLASTAQAIECKSLFSTSIINQGVLSMVKANGFTTSRYMADYNQILHPQFLRDLNTLGPEDIIFDGGAGRGNTWMQYLYDIEVPDFGTNRLLPVASIEKRQAKVIAASFLRPSLDKLSDHPMRAKADKDPRFRYIEGDIGLLLKKHPELRGQVSIITDVYGALKYSHFQKVLEVYLDLLKVGGRIYFSHHDVKISHNGKEISIVDYLLKVKGVQLIFEPGSYISRYAQEQNGQYVLIKTSSKTSVPQLDILSSEFEHVAAGGMSAYILQD